MSDLELAAQEFKSQGYSLAVVKNQEILFASRKSGLLPLLEAAEHLKEQLRGSALADKVIGKAAALLCLHFKISALYTPLLSQPAQKLLEKSGIHLIADSLTARILAPGGESTCPMEELTWMVDEPAQGYTLITQRIKAKGRT